MLFLGLVPGLGQMMRRRSWVKAEPAHLLGYPAMRGTFVIDGVQEMFDAHDSQLMYMAKNLILHSTKKSFTPRTVPFRSTPPYMPLLSMKPCFPETSAKNSSDGKSFRTVKYYQFPTPRFCKLICFNYY